MTTNDRIKEIHRNLGFQTADEWDDFWTKLNCQTGAYVCPDTEELTRRRSLIDRAANGESLDARKAYAAFFGD